MSYGVEKTYKYIFIFIFFYLQLSNKPAPTLSSISSSFSLHFMVVYSFSSRFIFFWLILRPKAMLKMASWSASNFTGMSFWKYWKRKELLQYFISKNSIFYQITVLRMLNFEYEGGRGSNQKIKSKSFYFPQPIRNIFYICYDKKRNLSFTCF